MVGEPRTMNESYVKHFDKYLSNSFISFIFLNSSSQSYKVQKTVRFTLLTKEPLIYLTTSFQLFLKVQKLGQNYKKNAKRV